MGGWPRGQVGHDAVPKRLASWERATPLLHSSVKATCKQSSQYYVVSMHVAIAKLLATQGVVILDGAQGTELERRGVDLAGSRLWSAQLLIDNPELVRDVTLDYLRAGSGERQHALQATFRNAT